MYTPTPKGPLHACHAKVMPAFHHHNTYISFTFSISYVPSSTTGINLGKNGPAELTGAVIYA
jgi:hypothetical protein